MELGYRGILTVGEKAMQSEVKNPIPNDPEMVTDGQGLRFVYRC